IYDGVMPSLCPPRPRLTPRTGKTKFRKFGPPITTQTQSFSPSSLRRSPAHRLRLPATQAPRKMPTLLCHNADESAPPHLDPCLRLSGDSDSSYPTVLEAYSK